MAPISIVRVFGPAQSGSLIGYCMVAASIGQMIAPPLAARIYEASGTFSTFMIVSVVLSVIIIFSMFAATSAKAIKKIEEAQKAA